MQDTHMIDSNLSALKLGATLKVASGHRSSNNLTDMPVEVLMQIALQLPCKEFSRFLQVNRTIYNIINSHYIWHQRFTDRFGQSILKSRLDNAKTKDTTPSSSPPSRPPSPRYPSDANTNISNTGSPSITSQVYHNHLDPASSVSSASSSASSPQLTQARFDNPSSSEYDEEMYGKTTKDQNTKKRKDRKVDLRETTEVSKEDLIELYKQFSRMIMPADDMTICHMGDRYWKMVESRDSSFGRMAQLQSVWWMDVVAVIRGVPPGRYKIQWRVKVTSDAPIVNSEFRAVLFDKDENAPSDKLESILFRPRNIQEFSEQTDTKVTKADRKPFRNLFRKDFTILELPGDLIVEDDFQNVYLQVRNHEGWKSGLYIDYVRLVDLDDPEKSKDRLSFRSGSTTPVTSGSDEEVNDEGEEYYPTTGLGIIPGVRVNPLHLRSRAFRQYNPVDRTTQLDVGARTPSQQMSETTFQTGTEASTSTSSRGNFNGGSSGSGSTHHLNSNDNPIENPNSWYKLCAALFIYCLYLCWTQ